MKNTIIFIGFFYSYYIPILYSAPISFNTALPVAQGEYLIREQIIINRSGDDPSGLERNRSENNVVTTLGYGINHQWTVFGTLPYRDINLKLDTNNTRVTRSNRGFADLTIFARYIAYKENYKAKTFRVAPFLGLKLPTANDSANDNLGNLPRTTQLSSGAHDIFAGVVLTWQSLLQQIDAQISYRMSKESNGFEIGRIVRFDGSYQYRIWRTASTDSIPDYLYAVLETNLIHQEKNRVNNATDDNSNGRRLFISPGIQYVTMRWIVEFAVQLPIVQDLNGTALKNSYIARSSFRYNF
ncbi:hypothetical protein MNBD_GAMMA22-847 [hydrothermal vent metagenome]|uniref:Transporter n=1 Tax=hydrothermal vent metagenome TaxID=652676 RepID=A0A3B1ACS0_9ZZZZ